MHPSFSTCDLWDAHKNAAPEVFRVLPPVLRDFGARRVFCGPVVTVKCYEDNSLVKAAVESTGFEETPDGRIGKVLVVDGAGSLRRALLGGNLGAAAARNGWLDRRRALTESTTSILRAGAGFVITYAAADLATWSRED